MKSFLKDNLAKICLTILIMGAIAALTVSVYQEVMIIEEEECWQVLKGSAELVIDEIVTRMEVSENALKHASEVMVAEGNVDSYEDCIFRINHVHEMTLFSRIDLLYPDGRLLLQGGEVLDVEEAHSFEKIVSEGKSVSVRSTDFITGEQVVYYYVPVKKEEQVQAILIGVLKCEELSENFQVTAYNGEAECCIVDYSDGSLIMDTRENTLGNIYETEVGKPLKGYDKIDLKAEIKHAKTGVTAYQSASTGKNTYMYYTPVGVYNWELLVVAQEDVIFSSVVRTRDFFEKVALAEFAILLLYLFWDLYNIHQLSKSKKETEKQLQISTALIECVTALSSYSDIDTAMNELLGTVNRYFKGNRTYLFDINYEKQTTSNTYEYVGEGVTAEIGNLQDVPLEVIALWIEKFKQTGTFYISDIDDDVTGSDETYEILAAQNIHSLIAVPLLEDGVITGFMGVDDPKENYRDLSLLSSVQFFIMDGLAKQREQKMLEELSFGDTLTGLYNRNKFNQVLEEHLRNPLKQVGVAYFDLNGLKRMNDQFGHEAGDRLIKNTAHNIQQIFRKEAYRIGGDEFVVIAADIRRETFEENIKEVCRLMEETQISISLGTAWCEAPADLELLLKEVDGLMYAHKQAQRKEANE